VRWFTRQRKAREFLGLHNFLDPEAWWDPTSFTDLALKAKKHFCRLKDAIGIAVRNMTSGQIFGELLRQLGLDLEKKWATGQSASGHRYRLRRINSDSWHYAQLYVKHRQSLTQDFSSPELVISEHPSGCNYSNPIGGGVQTLTNTQYTFEPYCNTDFLVRENGENSTCKSDGKTTASMSDYAKHYRLRFRVLLQTLGERTLPSDESPPEPSDIEFMGSQYLPLLAESPLEELLNGIADTVEVYGTAIWRQIWSITPNTAQSKILQALMQTFGTCELRELASALEVPV
jgi:hypothetical protein